MDVTRTFLRHTLATLAYRSAKPLRDAPADFGVFRPSPTSRTPLEILAHMGDLMDWALRMAREKPEWTDATAKPWPQEVARWFDAVAAFDAFLAGDRPLATPARKLFQGPVSDALQHTGQLTYLRRLHGAPIRGENYYLAEIEAGRVGAEQASPRKEFD